MKVRELFTREGFRASLKPRPLTAQNGIATQTMPAVTAAGAATTSPVPPRALVERREVLARELAELQWDLGGLVYEMASRDHFRLDVVVRRAAKLQQVDAQLGDVDRLIRLDTAGAEGTCPSCGALYAHGAVFCWQCGDGLMEQERPEIAVPHGSANGPGAQRR